ncbi:PIN domain-containing protein [Candidatus Woesearchaeota archaeon]|nr:PIN domain-containing protein [Candidatus Woesearchaeota archaeon]
MKKCLDTYALVEIAKGQPVFIKYTEEEFVISEITLSEFYLVILREYNQQTADYWYRKLEARAIPVSLPILIEAMKFKHSHRKQRISFFDAVGYIFSRHNNHLFVTGDKEFFGMPDVEFQQTADQAT